MEAKVRFMGEIVTPPHPCSTWNEKSLTQADSYAVQAILIAGRYT
jgi:hypothetical protein